MARNLSLPHEFHCFTDSAYDYAPGIVKRPLPQDGLAGWWNKIALFKPGLFPDGARILYLDLDTLITGSLDEIAAYDGEFAMLAQFFENVNPMFAGPQSGVMAWGAGFGGHIWQTYVNTDYPHLPGGDQAFLRHVHPHPDLWQAMYPGKVVSFKQVGGLVPPEACLACFHGRPAVHQVFPNGRDDPGVWADARMKLLGGFWWPLADIECWPVTLASADEQIAAVMRHVQRRRVCVQAGGNVGVFPAKLAALFDQVYTAEPDVANFGCLERNITAKNVRMCYAAFVGDAPQTVTLRAVAHNSGQSHLSADGDGVFVPTLRVDQLSLEACDLIYLDVEGSEKFALDGSSETIRMHRPVIAIEDNGLSERYGVAHGETPQWIIDTFNYRIAAKVGRDVILTPN